MTSTVTRVIASTIMSSSYGVIATGVGVVAITILIVVLAQRDDILVSGDTRAHVWLRAMDGVIAMLAIAYSLIVVVRLVELFSASYR